MKSLFIDSSRTSLSVAIIENKTLISSKIVDSHSKHSNFLMDSIKDLFTETNINIKDIDNIVALNGPGSFTGIRVCVTVAKTLAWSLNKKLYLLNNLEALKTGINNDIVISVIPDKLNDSYVSIYDNESSIQNYMNLNDKQLDFIDKNISVVYLDDSIFIENLFNKLKGNNNVTLHKLDAYNYVSIVDKALSNNNINVHMAEPIYLKKIDAEKKNVN